MTLSLKEGIIMDLENNLFCPLSLSESNKFQIISSKLAIS